jgi:hypothetical protein
MYMLTAYEGGLGQDDRISRIKGQSAIPAEIPVVMLTLRITVYGNK